MTLTVGKKETSGEDGGEPDLVVGSCVLGGFSESDEIRALVASLPDIHGHAATKEVATEKFLGEAVVVIRDMCPCFTSLVEAGHDHPLTTF